MIHASSSSEQRSASDDKIKRVMKPLASKFGVRLLLTISLFAMLSVIPAVVLYSTCRQERFAVLSL